MKKINDEKNFLLRGVVSGGWEVRFVYCGCTGAVNDIIKIQKADPAAAEILADAVSAVSLLRTTLEKGERETVRWRYNGTIGNLITEINSTGSIRALAGNTQPMASLQHITLDTLLCDGAVTISAIKQGAKGGILSNGITETMLREPSEALAYYLSTSEQIESIIITDLEWAKSSDDPAEWAGSILLQALPGCDTEKFVAALAGASVPRPQSNETPEDALKKFLGRIFGGVPVTVYEENAPHFKCSCSRERFISALQTLSKKERQEIAEGRKYISMNCEFCGKVCRIKPEEFI